MFKTDNAINNNIFIYGDVGAGKTHLIKKEVETHIGKYNGFNLNIRKNMFYESYELIVQGNFKYKIDLGDSSHGNMLRIENAINKLEERLNKENNLINEYKRNLENSKIEFEKPFQYEEELKEKSKRLAELDNILNMNSNDVVPNVDEKIENKLTITEKLKRNVEEIKNNSNRLSNKSKDELDLSTEIK